MIDEAVDKKQTDDTEKPIEMTIMDPVDRERCVRDLRLDLSGSESSTSGRKRKSSESHSTKNKVRRMDSMDKIVSPVIPQPGAWRKRPPQILPTGARNRHRVSSTSISDDIFPIELDRSTEDNNVQQDLFPDDIKTSGVNTSTNNDSFEMEADAKNENISINTTTTPIQINTSSASTTANQTAALPTAVGNMKLPSTSQLSTISKKDNSKYQYGNYNYHFGFNNLDESMDVRLVIFKRNASLFKDKDILDIGCNAGQIAIFIAKHFQSKSMVGIDIDPILISKARRNLSMYVRIPKTPTADGGGGTAEGSVTSNKASTSEKRRGSKSHNHHHHYHHHKRGNHQDKEKIDFFPISFPICYGSIPKVQQRTSDTTTTTTTPPPSSTTPTSSTISEHGPEPAASDQSSTTPVFPESVYFRTMNYVPNDESQLANDTQMYDLILCLSTTKWIHLNFGDVGLKLAFKRMFNQLRPGGKLILEAQNWASYKKRKKLTETTLNNYRNIEFFPNKFHEYLLGPEIGFSHSWLLGIPRHLNKGFRRPIQVNIF